MARARFEKTIAVPGQTLIGLRATRWSMHAGIGAETGGRIGSRSAAEGMRR